MESSLVSVVKRSNRKTFFISLGVLVLVGLIIFANANYYYNAIYGPFPKSKQQLLSIKDLRTEKDLYVEVIGDTVFESGFTEINQQIDKYTQRVQSENTVGFYQLLLLNEKFLVLYSSTQDTSTRRIGALSPLPDDLRRQLVESAGTQNDDWLLPFMLNTNPYSTNAYLGLAVMIPAAILSLLYLGLALRRSADPTRHPVYRSAVEEIKWLQQHHDTDLERLVPTCDSCSYHKKLFQSTYRSNVSYFIRRNEATFAGKFCLSCNSRLFLRTTLTTLVGTWWGIIGFFVGPIYILQNIYNYSKAIWCLLWNTNSLPRRGTNA